MRTHRAGWRDAAAIAVTLAFLPWLASCTPVREPARCDANSDCQKGASCNTDKHSCVASSAVKQDEDAAVAPLPACARDADCETSGACETVRCESDHCVRTPVPNGKLLPEPDQIVGDCSSIECDGQGHPKKRSDDSDQPMSDGNPCHARSCSNGEISTKALADGSDCNAGGICEKGECSKCFDGADCTGVDDCSVMRVRCDAGKSICESTSELISGKICGAGKVCSDGECTECRVGASCGTADPCQVSRITSCDPRICERSALTGTSCGTDAAGLAQICNAGQCVYACDNGSCNNASTNTCMRSVAICARPNADPTCSVTPVPDGSQCEANGTCHNGSCRRSALVNGDFGNGFEGWTVSGDAQNFHVAQDQSSDPRWSVSTWLTGPTGGGGSATGSVSQSFLVPDDAVALRFNIWGGEGYVHLRDASNNVLERVTGTNTEDNRVPVSWDLSTRRGQMLTVAIVDDIATESEWSFVKATGFDVIRAVPSVLINADFRDGLTAWEASGDGMHFNVYNDWNYGAPEHQHDDAYGRRMSVSTYVRTGSSRLGISSVGTLSQTFTVPADATALRFNLCGGKRTLVAVYDGATQLYRASPNDDDELKVPVSWDLTPFRGKALRLVIVDDVGSASYDYLGVSGFDLITAFNGP